LQQVIKPAPHRLPYVVISIEHRCEIRIILGC
jgi:hypothetical protein